MGYYNGYTKTPRILPVMHYRVRYLDFGQVGHSEGRQMTTTARDLADLEVLLASLIRAGVFSISIDKWIHSAWQEVTE